MDVNSEVTCTLDLELYCFAEIPFLYVCWTPKLLQTLDQLKCRFLNGLCPVSSHCADTCSFYASSSLTNITKPFPLNNLLIKGFADNRKAICTSACNTLAKRGLWISLTPVIAKGRYGFGQQWRTVLPSLWSHFQRLWRPILNHSMNKIFQLFPLL